jgi:hypothetical protein
LAPEREWSAQGIRASCSAAPILAPLRGGYIGASGAHSWASLRSAWRAALAALPPTPPGRLRRCYAAAAQPWTRGTLQARPPGVPGTSRRPAGHTGPQRQRRRSTWRQDRARLTGSSQSSSTQRPDCHSRGTGTRSGKRGPPGPSSTTWSTTAEGAERRHGAGHLAGSLAELADRGASPSSSDFRGFRAV